jgi:hypothetical protein
MTEKVVFHTLEEVKNKYFPNRSLEELEGTEKDKPFIWGDEIESPKEDEAEKDNDGQSHTSVAELLEDEEEREKKRLEEHLSKVDQANKPVDA